MRQAFQSGFSRVAEALGDPAREAIVSALADGRAMPAGELAEIAGISRAELHDIGSPANAAWLIPGTRTKNKRDHLVPLAPLAREVVLELLATIEPGEQYLFPTRSRQRSGPVRGNTFSHFMIYFARRTTGYDDAAKTWRADPPSPHDLRRTMETRLSALGVAKEVRDRVLNHVQGDVGSKHYNLHQFVGEKRAALMRFESALTAFSRARARPLCPSASGGPCLEPEKKAA